MSAYEDIALAVKRGAALLDERVPDWAERLDVGSLRLADECRCVLGQLYDGFHSGLRELGIADATMAADSFAFVGEVVDLGFYASLGLAYEWDALTEAWQREVHIRLDAS